MFVLFDFYAINVFPLFPVQVQLTVGSDFISDALFFCLFIDKLTVAVTVALVSLFLTSVCFLISCYCMVLF